MLKYDANARVRRPSPLAVATLLAIIATGTADAAGKPLPEASEPTIGYPSVEAAMSALRARRDVTFSTQGGWTIAEDPSGPVLWSFPPAGHAAYPSAVRRQIENGPDGASVNMSIHCEASKAACDNLVRSFQELNKQMARSLQGR